MGQGDLVDDVLISLLAILGFVFLILLVFEIGKFILTPPPASEEIIVTSPTGTKFSYEERIGKAVLAEKVLYSEGGNLTAHCRFRTGELDCVVR